MEDRAIILKIPRNGRIIWGIFGAVFGGIAALILAHWRINDLTRQVELDTQFFINHMTSATAHMPVETEHQLPTIQMVERDNKRTEGLV